MNSYSELICDSVFWISSLPDGEMGPTRRMTEELDQILRGFDIGFLHQRIQHVDELVNFLNYVQQYTVNRGLRPLIHFDAHGNPERGLFLSGQNSFYEWSSLATLLRTINIASQNNLIVVDATCYGLRLIWPMQLDAPTPFHVLLSPEREVCNGYLEDSVPELYRCLFQSGSLKCAYESCLQEQFSYIHCEKVFFDTMAMYIDLYCKEKASRIRREELLTIALSGSGVNSLGTRDIRRIIRESVKPNQERLNQYARAFLIGKDCGEDIRNLIGRIMSQDSACHQDAEDGSSGGRRFRGKFPLLIWSVGHHLLFAVRASIRVTRAPPLHNLSGHAVCALNSNG